MAQLVTCLGAEFRHPVPGVVTYFSKVSPGAGRDSQITRAHWTASVANQDRQK